MELVDSSCVEVHSATCILVDVCEIDKPSMSAANPTIQLHIYLSC